MDKVNERATIGGNNPPPDERITIPAAIAALTKEASDLSAAHPAFTDDETLALAAKLKRRSDALRRDADTARKREKEPHDEAGKEVQKFYLPLIARAAAVGTEMATKMDAELSRRQAAKEAAERQARAEAERLAKIAEAASAKAFDELEKVANGEVSDGDHIEAKQQAIDAHAAVKQAQAEAERIARTTSGVKVDGAPAVSVRRLRRVRLSFPTQGTREQRGEAVLSFLEYIARTRFGGDLVDEMTRIANQVYREMKSVPPHCEEYDEEKVY